MYKGCDKPEILIVVKCTQLKSHISFWVFSEFTLSTSTQILCFCSVAKWLGHTCNSKVKEPTKSQPWYHKEQHFKNNNKKQQTPRTLTSNILCTDTIVICTLFAVAGLYVLQRIGSTQEGNASFTLCGDYYNRELSGNKIYLQMSQCECVIFE